MNEAASLRNWGFLAFIHGVAAWARQNRSGLDIVPPGAAEQLVGPQLVSLSTADVWRRATATSAITPCCRFAARSFKPMRQHGLGVGSASLRLPVADQTKLHE